MKRKKFLKKIGWSIVALQAGFIFWDQLKPEKSNPKNQKWFRVGKLSELENNKIYPYQTGGFFLSVLKDKGLMAFSVHCTHLACVLHIKEDGFICPCHQSKFNEFGEVLSPPANRALDLFEIKVKSGIVWVNNHKAIERKSHLDSHIYYS